MTQNKGVRSVQLATASYTRTSHLVLVVPSRKLSNFSPRISVFYPLDPKFDSKTYVSVYILLKAIKNITNMKSKHQFISNSSFRSFFNKNPKFSIFIQNSKSIIPIQTSSHRNLNKHLLSEFEQVSTIIIHQFKLHS